MSKAVPWSIKGVDFDAREAAKEAARRDGVTLGDWMNRAIVQRAAETGSDVQDFDADERLEAVAAQLARLSRQSEDESERGSRRIPERDRAPAWVDEDSAPAPTPVPERAPRRRPSREPVAAPAVETLPRRESSDAEALLEKAVAAFETRAGRVEARTARALSDVAERIESAESERAVMLAQVDSRLADLETHLRKKARSTDVEPLRGALDRLESRIEDLASREPEPRDDETLRKLDRKLSNILARVESAETAPAAERDEHFARLEKRFDALLARLDRPAPSRTVAPNPTRHADLQGAIAEISARQRALDGAPASRPQAAPTAALSSSAGPAPIARTPVSSAPPPAFAAPPPPFDERFDALARKLERMAEFNAAPREDRRIDALQSGIEALSSRIEDMRRDFSSLQGAARDTAAPNVEKALRDLTHRVEALAAAQPTAAWKDVTALKDLAGLRGDLAGLTRTLGELAPRGAVAGLESAMRDLTNRVETTRTVVQRVAETRAEPSADIQALSRQLVEISRGLHDVAPRGAVAGVESAMRELANRVESAREIMTRVGERPLEPSPDFEALKRQLADIGRSLSDVAPRGAVAGLEHAVRDLSDRVDSTREIVARASERPAVDSTRDFEALNRQLEDIGRSLGDVAPRGAVAGLEHAVRDLSDRVDSTREIVARVSERPVLASTPDFEALNRQLADIGRSLGDVAPRGAVAGLEHAVRDLSDRVDSTREIVARVSERPALDPTRDFEALNRHLADIGRSLGDVAPRGAVTGLENAVRDLSDRVDSARLVMERATPAQGAVGVAEIEALGQQVAAMGRALTDVAPRSQIAALDLAVRDLSERVERSRDEGLRDSVLAPIEHLAADVRRAVAETGASADFDGVIRQMHALEDKIDDLRRTGGADRGDFLRACDQSDQLRASIATALERMAPLETMEKQVASLTDRLETLSRQSIEASRAHANGMAQTSANWREIGSRLDDLAVRIDRAADQRGEPAPSDEHRFDELSRRLDFMHQALAERIDGAVQARSQQAQMGLEPLLRALADKLESAMAPQADGRAIEALERQVAEVSERLERGASHSNIQLQQALADLAARIDQQRDAARDAARETLIEALAQLPPAGRDEQAARDIAELRERHENSDRRAQQTLSAVHETLEKVVDRLAMLEEDVQEVRDDARASAAEPQPPAQSALAPWAAATPQPRTNPAPVEPSRAQTLRQDFDAASFLVEPGAGRPKSSAASSTASSSATEAEDEHEFDVEAPLVKLSRDDEAALLSRSHGSNYIDVARRALAARAAADAVEREDGAQRRAPGGVAERAKDGAAKFIRPLAAGEKRGGARMGVLLAAGASVLAMGMFQLYRVATTPVAPPMQTVGPQAQISAPAPALSAPAAADAGAPQGEVAAAPAPAASTSAPVAAPNATPAQPAAKPARGASLSAPLGASPSVYPGASPVDPLAVSAIGPRNNNMSAIQAGAQAAALKDQAEKGDAAAQFELAARFAEGRGVDRDPATAMSWFQKAAAQGQPQAEYRLGVIFEKGLGVPRDARKAEDNYQKAAGQGHVRAMHNLAVIEAEGVDGKPDYASAAQWFRRAADYGVRDSQFNLAILYARGMGVSQNMQLSYIWFAAAADQGDADAAKKRDEIAGRLSASDLAAAKKQAAAFHPRAPAPAINEAPVPGVHPQASTTN
jgi:localization factor PodJL